MLDVNHDVEAPNGVRFEDNDWSANLRVLKPFGLSCLLSTDCGVIQGTFIIHIHSLLSLSLGRKRNDLHLKRSGKGVTPPIHSIPLSRLSCSCHVGREIGFQPESFASSYSHFMTIESVVLDEEVDPSSSSEYHFQIPSQTSHVVRDTLTTPPSYQVFSDGTLSSILDSCGDYWSGTSLLPLTGASEKKIVEFGQNALISDCQVVGFAYRPLQETSRLKKMEMEDEDD